MTLRIAVPLATMWLFSFSCSSTPPVVTDGGNCGDLLLANANCGRCGNVCADGNACAQGTCLPRACGTRTCSGENVCVDGVCADRRCFGVTCPANEACAGGSCYPTQCAGGCTPTQVCVNGACADAACVGVICPVGLTCAGGACLANTCNDVMKSGSETDIDCGGAVCGPCLDGRACAVALDCQSRVCTALTCAAPSCTDTVKNGQEGDIDCGGTCAPCASGRTCTVAAQCMSGVCTAGRCATASCTDGIKNGTETDLDCGSMCPACADQLMCGAASDCMSMRCSAGRCVSLSCSNGTKDGTETDLDCGGLCSGCAIGKVCAVGLDCVSLICSAATLHCIAPTCTDTVKNGTETDLDCGGPCPQCDVGKMCLLRTDCVTASCVGNVCRPATCSDGARNGGESDVDCGGAAGCARCGADGGCGMGADCLSGICLGTHCDVPTFFGTPKLVTSGGTPQGVTLSDADNDGLVDVEVANFGTGNIFVAFQELDAGLTPIPPLQVTQGGNIIRGPSTVAAGDLNGDGLPDLVTGRMEISGGVYYCRLSVLKGAGNRQFIATVDSRWRAPFDGNVSSGCGGTSLLARLNSDALLDVILGDGIDSFDTGGGGWPDVAPDYGGASAFFQDAGVDFSNGQSLTHAGSYIAMGDVNGDGIVDVVGHSGRYTQVSAFLGQASGIFTAPRSFGVAAGDGAIALGQLTAGDNNLDVVFATKGTGAVAVSKGLGTGDFLAPQSFTVASPDGVAVADIDGDGKLDVVVGAVGIAVLLGNGDGTLKPPVVSAASLGDVGPIAIGELNGDNKPDVACVVGGAVYVLYNVRP